MDIKSQYEAYEKSKTIELIADEEAADRMRINVGDKYTQFPPPTTREEALERLEKYTGLRILESRIKKFDEVFERNKRCLNDHLEKVNQFIKDAEKIPTDRAFMNVGRNTGLRLYYEYVRWTYGFYNKAQFYTYEEFIPADLAEVYGKYILFKKWLEEQIRELTVKQIPRTQIPKPVSNVKITNFEKIRKELNLIDWVFKSQFQKKSVDMLYPILHEDGRYCTSIYMRCDDYLLAIEPYKEYYTERYDKAVNTELIIKELTLIYNRASGLLDYFNKNLTINNPVIVEAMKPKLQMYSMIMMVENYDPYNIMFVERGFEDRYTDWYLKYNFYTTNKELSEKCLSLIQYIENFGIANLKDSIDLNISKDDITVNDGTDEGGSESKKKPEIPEKWSALLYLIELAINKQSLPENIRGDLSKAEIMKIAKIRGYKTGQYFYRVLQKTNLEKPSAIANDFDKEWKEKIINLSNKNEKIISFLQEKYGLGSSG